MITANRASPNSRGSGTVYSGAVVVLDDTVDDVNFAFVNNSIAGDSRNGTILNFRCPPVLDSVIPCHFSDFAVQDFRYPV